MCASVTARRLREHDVPEDLEIIEEDRILDKGGIEIRSKMLRHLPRIAQGTELTPVLEPGGNSQVRFAEAMTYCESLIRLEVRTRS